MALRVHVCVCLCCSVLAQGQGSHKSFFLLNRSTHQAPWPCPPVSYQRPRSISAMLVQEGRSVLISAVRMRQMGQVDELTPLYLCPQHRVVETALLRSSPLGASYPAGEGGHPSVLGMRLHSLRPDCGLIKKQKCLTFSSLLKYPNIPLIRACFVSVTCLSNEL